MFFKASRQTERIFQLDTNISIVEVKGENIGNTVQIFNSKRRGSVYLNNNTKSYRIEFNS